LSASCFLQPPQVAMTTRGRSSPEGSSSGSTSAPSISPEGPGCNNLQERIAALTASRRAGAAAVANEGSAEWLAGWLDQRHFVELDSTQSYVEREWAALDVAKLTAVSADLQTLGRGTGDRSWHAVTGQSILMTFYFRFPEECSTLFVNRTAPNATQVLAISAVDVLKEAAAGHQGCVVGLKWPNDVIFNGGKIGGVLARGIATPEGRMEGIIAGIGVNINTPQVELDKIERPIWPATSLRAALSVEGEFDVAALRGKLALSFAGNLRKLFVEGFSTFRERINSLDIHTGKLVRLKVAEQTVKGTYLGVNESGHIMIKPADGSDSTNVQVFPCGEVLPFAEALE